MKDLEKRRRVMARSMRLGHCICDPRKPCPCEIFRERDICLCAGERPEGSQGPVFLTRIVENPGCASKIDQASLKRILAGLPAPEDPRVLIGMPAGDDAGVYRLDDRVTVVQTVDVFSPSVDDPYLFGQVAAANSVSDVYAMGGRPVTALSIIGFPIRKVPDQIMRDILRGGLDKMKEAGVAVIGGHSIKDDEIKAGFAVTGLVDPARILANAGAQPGDALILTKPLGVGIISFAAQIDRAPAGAVEAAARSMTALNKAAAELMVAEGADACTDVTGFGLAGHLADMAQAGGVDVEIVWDDLPLLPGVLECLAAGIIPGGVERNRESSGDRVTLGSDVAPAMLDLCLDAQTSGGLLIAVPDESAPRLLRRLHAAGVTQAAVVGRVIEKGEGCIRLTTRGTRPIPVGTDFKSVPAHPAPLEASEIAACCAEEESGAPTREAPSAQEMSPPVCVRASVRRKRRGSQAHTGRPAAAACCSEPEAEPCCADGREVISSASAGTAHGAEEIQARFMAFMKSANAPGALDAATKQAVALSLSILTKCDPCTRLHIQKARQMGFSEAEIDEAAWMAVAFGGSPVMMFYREHRDTA